MIKSSNIASHSLVRVFRDPFSDYLKYRCSECPPHVFLLSCSCALDQFREVIDVFVILNSYNNNNEFP